MIKLVVACDPNGVIGNKGFLPWSIKEEIQHFKLETLYEIVVMGRNTWDSLKKPLQDRENVVLTKYKTQEDVDSYPDVHFVKSVNEAIRVYENYNQKNLCVIGGKSVYEAFLPEADMIVVSRIHKEYKGDVSVDFTKEEELKKNFTCYHTLDYDEFTVEYWERDYGN